MLQFSGACKRPLDVRPQPKRNIHILASELYSITGSADVDGGCNYPGVIRIPGMGLISNFYGEVCRGVD